MESPKDTRASRDYTKSKVYILQHKNGDPKLRYVGSTAGTLAKRLASHKTVNGRKLKFALYKAVQEHGGWGAWTLELIEDFPCERLEQLRAREGYWIRQLDTYTNGLNMEIPGRSRAEYNREHNPVYRAKNRDALSAYARENYRAHADERRAIALAYHAKHKDDPGYKEKACARVKAWKAKKKALREAEAPVAGCCGDALATV